MIELISALTGYALGVSQNAAWDFVKIIVAGWLRDRPDVNLEKLFLEAFYKAVDEHNQHYDAEARRAVLEFKRQVQTDPAKFFDVLREFNYEGFGQFIASIEREELQHQWAEKLHERYLSRIPEKSHITVQALADTVRFYRSSVLGCIRGNEAALLTLYEVLNIRRELIRLQPSPVEPIAAPLWLPRRDEGFVNREEELERLISALKNHKVVGVCGMGGVGKTALANEAVHRLKEDFKKDGIIWLSGERITMQGLLQTIILAYEHLPLPLWDWEKLGYEQILLTRARKWLNDRRPLICLDDVHESRLIGQVLEIASDCAVLVTSRHRLDALQPLLCGGEVEGIDLDCLTPPKAVQLLESKLGRSLSNAQKETALKICKMVGFLPLAIELVAAMMRIGGEPLDRMLDRLQEHKKLLDRLQVDEKSVRASFEVTYNNLKQEEKQLFTTLGFFAGVESLDTDLVKSVCDISEIERKLENLAICSLLGIRDGRIEIHPLLHLFARQKLEELEERDEASPRSVAQSLLTYVIALPHADQRRYAAEINAAMEWCMRRDQLDLLIEYRKVLDWQTGVLELDQYLRYQQGEARSLFTLEVFDLLSAVDSAESESAARRLVRRHMQLALQREYNGPQKLDTKTGQNKI